MKGCGRWAAILAFGVSATAALGDGGSLLLRQDVGLFTITLFAAPQPLTTGEADLSVMVQDRNSGDVLLDPVIDATAVSEEDAGAVPETVRLTSKSATNRLLQSGRMRFSRPGRWRVNLHVRRGDSTADLSTDCAVQADTSRAAIVWFYVLLPVAVILLFLLHQFLKQSQAKRMRAR